jgi:hypothetical protein
MPPPANVLTLSRSAPKDAPAASAAPSALPPGSRRLDDGRIVPVPPVTKSGAETRAQADRVNYQPLPIVDSRPISPWRPFVEGGAFHDRWRNNN